MATAETAGACRLSGCCRRPRRHAWHRRGCDNRCVPPGVRLKPDLRCRAPRATRPECGPARAGRTPTDHSAGRGGIMCRHARRSRRVHLPRRPRRHASRNPVHKAVPFMTQSRNGPLRVGVGGPVGTGKTALMDALCKRLRTSYDIAAITNDIYTKEDAEFLTRAGSLPPERILGIETGGCPHTAIREDASINLAGVAELNRRFPDLDIILIESVGDNLAATFSPELADLTIYVIDVSAGDKIPRKGGPGITRSDLLVINKIDL